jgi:hypothetical protein
MQPTTREVQVVWAAGAVLARQSTYTTASGDTKTTDP